MARIKMHIPKAKLPFYPPCEVKCRLQNGVSTNCASFSNPPYVINTSKYRPERKLSSDNNYVCLEVMGKLSCSMHHRQNGFLQW